MFAGKGCFDGMFTLQVKDNSKTYQPLQRYVAYALYMPFKEEKEQLQKLDISTIPCVDEMVEWCNSFVLESKAK